MNNIEILEELSDNEHSRWANWQKYVHSKCIKNKDGSLTIPKEYVDHWNYEINTEYKDLPENIKESDRKEARKILETLNYKNLIQENKELKEKFDVMRRKIYRLEEDNIELLKPKGKDQLNYKYIECPKVEAEWYKSESYIEENYIPKSKVKEKIEILEKCTTKIDKKVNLTDYMIIGETERAVGRFVNLDFIKKVLLDEPGYNIELLEEGE